MSIITEALKKAEKERNKVIHSKEYLNKILGPRTDMSLYKKDILDEQRPSLPVYDDARPAVNTADWRPSRSLLISGALIIGAILFLSAINIFIVSSPDVERAVSGEVSLPAKNAIEAETYTTAMQPDINLIEQKTTILGRMGRIIKGGTVRDEFLSNFTLNGIMYDTDNSWAIINNQMVKTGDILNGAQVVSISPQKVALVFKRETFDLTVK